MLNSSIPPEPITKVSLAGQNDPKAFNVTMIFFSPEIFLSIFFLIIYIGFVIIFGDFFYLIYLKFCIFIYLKSNHWSLPHHSNLTVFGQKKVKIILISQQKHYVIMYI